MYIDYDNVKTSNHNNTDTREFKESRFNSSKVSNNNNNRYEKNDNYSNRKGFRESRSKSNSSKFPRY